MNNPTEAQQLATLADLCDAVDPFLPENSRLDALLRASNGQRPDFALAAVVGMLHAVLLDAGDRTGELMVRLRGACGRIEDVYPGGEGS